VSIQGQQRFGTTDREGVGPLTMWAVPSRPSASVNRPAASARTDLDHARVLAEVDHLPLSWSTPRP